MSSDSKETGYPPARVQGVGLRGEEIDYLFWRFYLGMGIITL